jgi:Na+/melibiose symporter-like transporter
MPFIRKAAHFVTRQQNNGEIFLGQPESAILGIKMIVGMVPGAAMLLGAIILAFYPLRGQYLAEVQEKVLVLHAEKHARLENMQLQDGFSAIH